MSRTCTICTHPQRAEIDQALATGPQIRAISALFRVSEDALARHKAAHLPVLVSKSAMQEEIKAANDIVGSAIDVVKQLKTINNATLHILREAKEMGAYVLQLQAIDRVYRQIELQAKLLGELDRQPNVNILINPQWLEIRTMLMDALQPFPSARMAVAGKLVELENGRAS
jgi:hypothetical protein